MTVSESLVAEVPSAKTSSCCASKAEPTLCYHCGALVPSFSDLSVEVDGKAQPVCCSGCQSAAQFILSRGLGAFYLERDTPSGQQRVTAGLDYDLSDWPVQELGANEYAVTASIPGMYCSSCARLIDKALGELPVAVDAQVRVAAKQVDLCWHGTRNDLQTMISQLSHLGYAAYPVSIERTSDEQSLGSEHAQYLKRMLVAGLGTMQVMTYATAHYLGAEANPDLARLMELVSMLVASVVVLYAGQGFFANAIRDLKHRHLGMDVPVALAIGSAFFLSAVQTLLVLPNRQIYYDSAVMFVFFLLIGRYVESRTRHQFVDTNSAIGHSLPSQVPVHRTFDNRVVTLDLAPRQIQVGDELKLSAGDVVPCDGLVIGGRAELNESLLTGESEAKLRSEGAKVTASMQVVSGHVVVRCDTPWAKSALAAIERMSKSAQTPAGLERGALAALNRYFVMSVLVLTLFVGLFWLWYQPARAFEIVLAMLIATCPCAFALAAPIGHTVASNLLRQFGVLLGRPGILHQLASAKSWWFDKTGTLTQGKPRIRAVHTLCDLQAESVLSLIAALEQGSKHPLAAAFAGREVQKRVSQRQEIAGGGISGNIEGQDYFAGNLGWIANQIDQPPEALAAKLKPLDIHPSSSMICLATPTAFLAVIELEDAIRPGLDSLLQFLRKKGIRSHLISGDNINAVTAFARSHEFEEVHANISPARKVELLKRGCSMESTVMVGDGANDAPVLANADIGIAFASGSELSQAQADVLVINSHLDALIRLQAVAERTRRITQQNLVWAIAYNLTILPLAATGLLTPWIAALGMSLSSLLVVLNAARIRRIPRSNTE